MRGDHFKFETNTNMIMGIEIAKIIRLTIISCLKFRFSLNRGQKGHLEKTIVLVSIESGLRFLLKIVSKAAKIIRKKQPANNTI